MYTSNLTSSVLILNNLILIISINQNLFSTQFNSKLVSTVSKGFTKVNSNVLQVDFSMVPEVWWNENENDVSITLRAKRFRKWLFDQPEKCMVVVSHAGFLHELLQEQFRNCELKRINWVHKSRRQAKNISATDSNQIMSNG